MFRCFNIADMSWAERKMAESMFGSPPTSTFQEVKSSGGGGGGGVGCIGIVVKTSLIAFYKNLLLIFNLF